MLVAAKVIDSFHPDNGGDTFVCNVGCKKNLTASHPTRRHSSKTLKQIIRCGRVNWIALAQDTDKWRAFVNAVMNIRFP
jgi:hypothetical protein